MCIFTGPVDVCNTSIFARRLAGHLSDRQCLVYQMHYASKSPVAMVLPIPVLRPNETDAINFIDLKHYPDFFDHMHRAFPSRGGDLCLSAEPETLEVHKVGDFVASFVPTLNDFGRLDKVFRLADDVWDQIPQYKDFSFAVFQLSKTLSRSFWRKLTTQEVHPMAFEFRSRMDDTIFFPTIHIHDGHVEPLAKFDHALFFQSDSIKPDETWRTTSQSAEAYLDVEKSRGTIDGQLPIHMRLLKGKLANEDTLIQPA